jgi:hypothetical protein
MVAPVSQIRSKQRSFPRIMKASALLLVFFNGVDTHSERLSLPNREVKLSLRGKSASGDAV